MDFERNITMQPDTTEPEKGSEPAFSTFQIAAAEMPHFSDAELAKGLDNRWRRRTTSLFQRVERRVEKKRSARLNAR